MTEIQKKVVRLVFWIVILVIFEHEERGLFSDRFSDRSVKAVLLMMLLGLMLIQESA